MIVIERKPGMDEDEVMMAALDAGASDVDVLDDSFEVTTTVSDFSAVRDNLEKAGYTFLSAELTMIPQTTNEITDPETVEKIQKMLEMLDDLDDVQDVYHNGGRGGRRRGRIILRHTQKAARLTERLFCRRILTFLSDYETIDIYIGHFGMRRGYTP